MSFHESQYVGWSSRMPTFDFSRLLFFAFFGVFSGDFGYLYSRSIPDLLLFLNYFLSASQWASFS